MLKNSMTCLWNILVFSGKLHSLSAIVKTVWVFAEVKGWHYFAWFWKSFKDSTGDRRNVWWKIRKERVLSNRDNLSSYSGSWKSAKHRLYLTQWLLSYRVSPPSWKVILLFRKWLSCFQYEDFFFLPKTH
jgi:hypothetical protein